MKTAEVRELSTKEIKERIEDEKSMLVKMKLNHHISPMDNPLKLRSTRRIIAKLITELHSRETKELNK
ncbi:MAG: 50S ribosomal protein L29 [Bacteroidetes bacterium GWA2_32_17]|nr:MAG: 50S ribosomal protein L29 [Bacteroidetes bacterium GWA2_32_17]